MFVPPGFSQKSVQSHLGYIVYYTNDRPPWNTDLEKEPETLVFLHGLGGGSSAYEWSKVYPGFATEYRILAPDLIGWGRSAHPQHNYIPEDYIISIEKFIKRTCSKPVTVIASANLPCRRMLRILVMPNSPYPQKLLAKILKLLLILNI